MKSLDDQIKDILIPNNSLAIVQDKKIYHLHPLFPVSQYLEMLENLSENQQTEHLLALKQEGIVIYNGIIYECSSGLNFQGRLKEILSIYNSHLKKTVGSKKSLLKLLETITPFEISNLTQEKVIFMLKKFLSKKNHNKKGLVASRYLPQYEIYFNNKIYVMPPCTIVIYLDDNLNLDIPEIISEDGSNFYEHPFVFRDKYKFGQKVCMGTFTGSMDNTAIRSLKISSQIISTIKQVIQILITGYNQNVNPANGHLATPQYEKYLK